LDANGLKSASNSYREIVQRACRHFCYTHSFKIRLLVQTFSLYVPRMPGLIIVQDDLADGFYENDTVDGQAGGKRRKVDGVRRRQTTSGETSVQPADNNVSHVRVYFTLHYTQWCAFFCDKWVL